MRAKLAFRAVCILVNPLLEFLMKKHIHFIILTIVIKAFLDFLPCICCERLAEVGAGAETGGSAEQDAGSSGVRSPT